MSKFAVEVDKIIGTLIVNKSLNVSGSTIFSGPIVFMGPIAIGSLTFPDNSSITSSVLKNTIGVITVNWSSRILFDSLLANSLNWQTRQAYDAAGLTSMFWGNRTLIDTPGVISVDWENRTLNDAAAITSLGWTTRILYYPDTTPAIDWSVNGAASVTGDIKYSGVVFVTEGTGNASQGVVDLVAGVATVFTTQVAADSRIFLTSQVKDVMGTLRVNDRTVGTSFDIESSNLADNGAVAWLIHQVG